MKTAITLCMLFTALGSFSQKKLSDGEKKARAEHHELIGSMKPEYINTLSDEFSRILLGENASIGSFATLSTSNDIATFSGSFKADSNSIINITAKGGITEGVIPFIKEGNTNPDISLSATYNFGLYRTTWFKKDRLGYKFNATDFIDAKQKEDQLIDSIDQQKRMINNRPTVMSIELQEKRFEQRTLRDSIGKINKLLNSAEIQTDENTRQMMNFKLEKCTSELDELSYQIKRDSLRLIQISDLDQMAFEKALLDRKYHASRKMLQSNLGFEAFRMRWISLGAKYNFRSFNSLVDSVGYSDQVVKRSGNNWEFSLAYNFYRKEIRGRIKNIYISTGLSLTIEDNFDDLDKLTLSEKKDIGSGRSTTSTKTVYEGGYLKNQVQWKEYIDCYWFLNKGGTLGLHGNVYLTQTEFNNFSTQLNTKVGLVLGVRNNEDKKSILNVELYTDLQDLLKKNSADEKFSDRVFVGMNFNFPIAFKQTLKQ